MLLAITVINGSGNMSSDPLTLLLVTVSSISSPSFFYIKKRELTNTHGGLSSRSSDQTGEQLLPACRVDGSHGPDLPRLEQDGQPRRRAPGFPLPDLHRLGSSRQGGPPPLQHLHRPGAGHLHPSPPGRSSPSARFALGSVQQQRHRLDTSGALRTRPPPPSSTRSPTALSSTLHLVASLS
jgi:hypothetical protein